MFEITKTKVKSKSRKLKDTYIVSESEDSGLFVTTEAANILSIGYRLSKHFQCRNVDVKEFNRIRKELFPEEFV